MNKASVPRTSASKYTCSSCGKYLSVAPIYLAEDKYICGRCPPAGSRLLAYEEMAQYLIFPCVHESCKQTLAWGDVPEHERSCVHRTVPCPISECQSPYELDGMEAHFEAFHKNRKFVREVAIPGVKIGDLNGAQKDVYLLMHNQLPYLVFSYRNLEKKQDYNHFTYQIGVFSVRNQSVNLKYDVSLTFVQEENSTTISTKKNQEVKFYDETIHHSDHINSITVSKFESLHNQDSTILLDLKLCDPNYVEPAKICESLVHNFECPICNEVMRHQVFLCLRGHSICSCCKVKVKLCPFCQSNFGTDCRNYFLEEVMSTGKPQKKAVAVASGFSFNYAKPIVQLNALPPSQYQPLTFNPKSAPSFFGPK